MRQHRTPGESRVLAGPQSLRVRGGTQMLRTELLSPRAPQPETQPPPGEAGASPAGPSSRSNSHCPNAEGAGATSGPPRPQHPPASGRAEGPEPSPGCRQNKATGLAQVPRYPGPRRPATPETRACAPAPPACWLLPAPSLHCPGHPSSRSLLDPQAARSARPFTPWGRPLAAPTGSGGSPAPSGRQGNSIRSRAGLAPPPPPPCQRTSKTTLGVENVDFWAALPQIQIPIPHFFRGWGPRTYILNKPLQESLRLGWGGGPAGRELSNSARERAKAEEEAGAHPGEGEVGSQTTLPSRGRLAASPAPWSRGTARDALKEKGSRPTSHSALVSEATQLLVSHYGKKVNTPDLKPVWGEPCPHRSASAGACGGSGNVRVLPPAPRRSLPQRRVSHLGPAGPAKPAGTRRVTQWKPEGPGPGVCVGTDAPSRLDGQGSRVQPRGAAGSRGLCPLEGWGQSPGKERETDRDGERVARSDCGCW